MKPQYHAVMQIEGEVYGAGWSYDSAIEDARLILGAPKQLDIVEFEDAKEFDLICMPCEEAIYFKLMSTNAVPECIIDKERKLIIIKPPSDDDSPNR